MRTSQNSTASTRVLYVWITCQKTRTISEQQQPLTALYSELSTEEEVIHFHQPDIWRKTTQVLPAVVKKAHSLHQLNQLKAQKHFWGMCNSHNNLTPVHELASVGIDVFWTSLKRGVTDHVRTLKNTQDALTRYQELHNNHCLGGEESEVENRTETL